MPKGEFVVALVVLGVGLIVIVLFLMLGAGLGGVGVTHHGYGCSGVPLVNGQPAYTCGPTPPP